uniref:Uncharacterized protein n=2 Tax=Choreotrichia TaxID=141411 RepID=A0A7S3I0P1_9SPIT|mmetsp:Transcript_23678/g.29348  ORF Transcript_23678/g.29348 Transcript_23678/m.29348 type:complete len:247 (+) Transcript_23678:325-1065(+)
MFADLSVTMSQVEFFGVALSWAISSGIYAFRYRSKSAYYTATKMGTESNWYETSDKIRLYGGLALGCLLATTQLLAIFGIVTSQLNGLIWMLVGGLGGMILHLAVGVMRFLGMEAAVKNSQGTVTLTDFTAKGVQAGATIVAIKGDTMEDAVMDAASMIALAGAAEGWYFGMWNDATDEEQQEWIEEWEETVATRAEEIAADKGPAAKAEEGEQGEEAKEGEEGEEGEDAEEGEEGEEAEEGDEDK